MNHPKEDWQMSDAVINLCGFCGETFRIDASDPHWVTGRGPLCPNIRPGIVSGLPDSELHPTDRDHVVGRFARCRTHNTIRTHAIEPCWKCWQERRSQHDATTE
jgi:hypothetical protein